MLCESAAHSKAALLCLLKESLSTETCAHTCQSQFTLSVANVRNTQLTDATLVLFQSKQKIPGEGMCATGLRYTTTQESSERPADLFTFALQAKTILHKSATNMKNISQFSFSWVWSQMEQTQVREGHRCLSITAFNQPRLRRISCNGFILAQAGMNAQHLYTKAWKSEGWRWSVSARCQVDLGMLAKANKFSRVFALQNSSKGDGMSIMRLVD